MGRLVLGSEVVAVVGATEMGARVGAAEDGAMVGVTVGRRVPDGVGDNVEGTAVDGAGVGRAVKSL